MNYFKRLIYFVTVLFLITITHSAFAQKIPVPQNRQKVNDDVKSTEGTTNFQSKKTTSQNLQQSERLEEEGKISKSQEIQNRRVEEIRQLMLEKYGNSNTLRSQKTGVLPKQKTARQYLSNHKIFEGMSAEQYIKSTQLKENDVALDRSKLSSQKSVAVKKGADNNLTQSDNLSDAKRATTKKTSISTTTQPILSTYSKSVISPIVDSPIYEVNNSPGTGTIYDTVQFQGLDIIVITDAAGGGTGTVTFTSDYIYELSGPVYVNSGDTLTIEPGALIKGANSGSILIVANGAYINAQGTPQNPILFTWQGSGIAPPVSDFNLVGPGDPASPAGFWGGLAILGDAVTNRNSNSGIDTLVTFPNVGFDTRDTFGGTDTTHNAGILSYVSIRYAGSDNGSGTFANGLTLAGVGSGTTINNVEVTRVAGDGVQINGGNVNLSNVMIESAGDNGLSTDLGYNGKIQFISVISPGAAAAEHDGGTGVDETGTPISTPTIYNATYFGQGFQDAANIKENARVSYTNSYFINFSRGFVIEHNSSQTSSSAELYGDTTQNATYFEGNIFKNVGGGTINDYIVINDLTADYGLASLTSLNSDNIQFDVFEDQLLVPTSDIFRNELTGDPFIQAVNYVGAFVPNLSGTPNPWYQGWTRVYAVITVRGVVVDTDYNALVDIYNALNGTPPWPIGNDIFGSFDWEGVEIEGNRVTGISLSGYGLDGTISPQISNLSTLRYLFLENNNIFGSIPPEIGQLRWLRDLYLNGNQLSGSLPAEMGNMSSLAGMNLDVNALSGAIPATFGQLSELNYLSIGENQFTSLPDELNNTNLEIFYGYDNQFVDLPSLDSLQLFEFHVQGNFLEFNDLVPFTQIPGNFVYAPQNPQFIESVETAGNITFDGTTPLATSYLWLDEDFNAIPNETNATLAISNATTANNGLYRVNIESDTLPGLTLRKEFEIRIFGPTLEADSTALVAIYQATNGQNWQSDGSWLNEPAIFWDGITFENGRVVAIDLDNRNLTGAIPPEISQLTALRRFNIWNNQVEYLPSELYSLTGITYMDLDNNPLGQISPAIVNLTNLDTLWMGNIGLQELPMEIFELSTLNLLDIRDNNINEEMPAELGLLTELEYLNIQGNPIFGLLPNVFDSIPNLRVAYLGYTDIEAPLPNSFYRLDSLRILRLGNSNIVNGSLPTPITNFENLELLDVSQNDFNGNFPLRATRLTNLQYFVCITCNIQGQLPTEINNWTNLIELDLGFNDITAFPAGYTSNTLEQFLIIDNEIENLPDLTQFPNLVRFSIMLNKLTYDDLAPLIPIVENGVNFDNTVIQKALTPTDRYVIGSGDNLTLAMTAETNTSPVYTWYSSTSEFGPYNVVADSSRTYNITNASNPEDDLFYYGEAFEPTVSPFFGVTLYTGDGSKLEDLDRFQEDVSQWRVEVSVQDPVSTIDSLALISLYDSLNGDEWGVNWKVGLPVEDWDYVMSFDGFVRSIDIQNFVTGGISPNIGSMDSLETFIMNSGGDLRSPIPNQLFLAQSLRFVDFNGIGLTGPIPTSIGTATNLEFFGAARNELTGSIPAEIGNAINLRDLYLDDNALSGAVPNSITSLPLIGLSLDWNELTALPADTLDFTNANYVNFAFNYLPYADVLKNINIPGRFDGIQEAFGAAVMPLTVTAQGDSSFLLEVTPPMSSYEARWYRFDDFGNLNNIGNSGVSPSFELFTPVEEGYYFAEVFDFETGLNWYSESKYVGPNNSAVAENVTSSNTDFAPDRGPEKASGFPILNPFPDERTSLHYQDRGTDLIDTLSFDITSPTGAADFVPNRIRFYESYDEFEFNALIRAMIAFNGAISDTVYVRSSGIPFQGEGKSVRTFETSLPNVDRMQIIYSNNSGPVTIDAIEVSDNGVPFFASNLGAVSSVLVNYNFETDFLGENEYIIQKSTTGDFSSLLSSDTLVTNELFPGFRDQSVAGLAEGTYYYRTKIDYGVGNTTGFFPTDTVDICRTPSTTPILDRGIYTSYSFPTGEGTIFVTDTLFHPGEVYIDSLGNGEYFISDYTGSFFEAFFGEAERDQSATFLWECDQVRLVSSFANWQPSELSGGFDGNGNLRIRWVESGNNIIRETVLTRTGTRDARSAEVKPPAPQNLFVALPASDSIYVSWDVNEFTSDGFDGLPTSVRVQRSSDGLTFNDIATIPYEPNDNFIEFGDENLLNGQRYYYRIIANNAIGNSIPSSERWLTHKPPLLEPVLNAVTQDTNRVSSTYSGIWGDYDNDGDEDLYVTNAFDNSFNQFFVNEGNGNFTEVTNELTSFQGFTRSASWGDFDNDGFLDIFVPGRANETTGEVDARVYRNLGGTGFELAYEFNTTPGGLTNSSTEGGAWGDVDKDGFIELVTTAGYILGYDTASASFQMEDSVNLDFDDSYGFFQDAWTVRLVDVENDGDLDIYFSDDNTGITYPSQLWRNDSTGFTLDESSILTGLVIRSSTFADFDNDGDMDMFVGWASFNSPNPDDVIGIYTNNNGQFSFNRIDNLISGNYEEFTGQRGFTVADFNNDGWTDIIWNGTPRVKLLLNNRFGGFNIVNDQTQLFPELPVFSHVSVADFNNDGSADAFLPGFRDQTIFDPNSNLDGRNYLFANNLPSNNNWVKVKLNGTQSNSFGIGSKITVTSGGLVQTQDVNTQNGLSSGNSLYPLFGLGARGRIDSIRVDWPNGSKSVIFDVLSNQLVEINQTAPVDSADLVALIELYNETGGDSSWIDNTNWLSEEPIESWFGVELSQGRVVGLNLAGNNLTGKIPDEIGNLTALATLDLSDNNITQDIPATIANMESLRVLKLSDNELGGAIPASLSALSRIVEIRLRDNNLSGQIPASLGALADLRVFNVSNNLLLGSIPDSLGSMLSLEVFNISNNGITDSIPESFGNLSNLRELRADSNQLIGNMPEAATNWDFLKVLSLRGNQIEGSLNFLVEADSLNEVFVDGNMFSVLPDLSNKEFLQRISVAGNQLDFGDLEPNAGLSNFTAFPQDTLGVETDIIVDQNADTVLFFDIAGASNFYQWYFDGSQIVDATFSSYNIPAAQSTDDGEYSLVIKNDFFPDDSLFTKPIVLVVTSLARDQAALEAIYSATGGGSTWTAENWDSGTALDAIEWQGVTLNEDQTAVVGLDLSGLGITGTIPRDLRFIVNLDSLDLSDNAIRSIPDLSRYDLSWLDVRNNRLAPASLLPNLAAVKADTLLKYADQANILLADKIDTIPAGDDLTRVVNVQGRFNTYQWSFRFFEDSANADGFVNIDGATNPFFVVDDIDYDKMGDYKVTVRNSELPDYEVETEPYTLLASEDIFGRVFLEDSISVLEKGFVEAYRIQPIGTPYDTAGRAQVFPDGSYAITDVVLGDLIVKIQPDSTIDDVIQSYFRQADDWLKADTLRLREKIENIDLYGISNPGASVADPDETPIAIFTGLLESDFEADQEEGRIEARRRVRKAGCSLRRRSRGGRTDQDEFDPIDFSELVAYTETDENGNFSFDAVPPDVYLLNIQYPGVPMDESSDVFIEVEDKGSDEVQFQINATITEDGITVITEEILGRLRPYIKDAILYPNPTDGIIRLDYLVSRRMKSLNAQLIDLKGNVLRDQKLDHERGQQRMNMDITELASGIYMLKLINNDAQFTFSIRIVKK